MEFFNAVYESALQVAFALAPWLIFGLLFAGFLHVLLPQNFMHKHFGKKNTASIVKSAAIGVPMPLCSCAVVPTALAMKKNGASNAASTSFLISTPQIGVNSLFVAASFFGLPFAIFKAIAAFITGITAGIIINLTEKNKPDNPAQTFGVQNSPQDSSNSDNCTSNTSQSQSAEKQRGKILEMLHFSFLVLFKDIYLWILFGALLSALIGAVIPEDYFAGSPFLSGIGGMFIMLLIALPLYVCSTSSVPIAFMLVTSGLPTGAALVFLMAGPATNLATLGAVLKGFGKRITLIYLITVAALSLIFGALFDFVIAPVQDAEIARCCPLEANWLEIASAIILVALLIFFIIRDLYLKLAKAKMPAQSTENKETIIMVSGMSCIQCETKVKAALGKIGGVSAVSVNLSKGIVMITGETPEHSALIDAIKSLGYDAEI